MTIQTDADPVQDQEPTLNNTDTPENPDVTTEPSLEAQDAEVEIDSEEEIEARPAEAESRASKRIRDLNERAKAAEEKAAELEAQLSEQRGEQADETKPLTIKEYKEMQERELAERSQREKLLTKIPALRDHESEIVAMANKYPTMTYSEIGTFLKGKHNIGAATPTSADVGSQTPLTMDAKTESLVTMREYNNFNQSQKDAYKDKCIQLHGEVNWLKET